MKILYDTDPGDNLAATLSAMKKIPRKVSGYKNVIPSLFIYIRNIIILTPLL